ncbi:hypothetical protein ACF1AK_36420, partial [Kitasatospora sp. NPDC015120]
MRIRRSSHRREGHIEMGHGHGHGVAEQAASASGKHVRKLWIAVGLGLVTFVTQVIVGLSTSSLAL